MRSTRLIRRSLVHHAPAHLGAWLGAAVAGAVLVGALVVGDSVRGSLERLARVRLGKVELAMATGDRLFTEALANSFQASLAPGQSQPWLAAPVLQLPGVAIHGERSARANEVQVLGVDPRFWRFAEAAPWPAPGSPTPAHADAAATNLPPQLARLLARPLEADSVILNQPLATQLEARPGDSVLLRVRKPSSLSGDAPLAPEEDTAVALRLRVVGVVQDEEFGRFSLAANQAPPLNAFVALAALQQRTEVQARANLLLIAAVPFSRPVAVSGPAAVVVTVPPPGNRFPSATNVLARQWRIEDAELEIRPQIEASALEMRSRRVFLDPGLSDAVRRTLATTNGLQQLPGARATALLTYFVNELRLGDRATPYSMVTAAEPPYVPADLGDDEILLSQWLAEDLGAKPGDTVAVSYYVVGILRALEERTARFRVRDIYPMDQPGIDRTLMPDFPGMTDAENCRDWDTGLPIDSGRIRPKDEQYWETYRGTPKALINLKAGQALWSNRFGDLTAIRVLFPAAAPARASGSVQLTTPSPTNATPARTPGAAFGPAARPPGRPGTATLALAGRHNNLAQLLRSQLSPSQFGLIVQPVRDQAKAASTQSQDFGQLFLGFSFFLVAAALLLLWVLFQFSIERRATEVGTLLALGFTPGRVRRLLLAEGAVVALLGGALGVWAGQAYARAMLAGLATLWNDAVGGAALSFHVQTRTLWIGGLAAALIAWATMGLALRRQVRQSARRLLDEGAGEDEPAGAFAGVSRRRHPRASRLAWAAVALAGVLILWPLARGDTAAAGFFFGAGALLLVAGLAACAAWLARLGKAVSARRLTPRSLAVRSATRRSRRSLAVIGLLACGGFLIASIGVFRLDAVQGATRRTSGTGGFAFIGNSTQPVIHDLNTARGREAYGLDTNRLASVSVVPFRVRPGEDASCLNLNRAQVPQLLGVKAASLADRAAFRFARVARGLPADHPWLLLRHAPPDPDTVPAIADEASIVWALGKRVGDTLLYTDEQGRTFKLWLVASVANSILQGNLVIDEDAFVRRFPSITGYRLFLIDAPPETSGQASAELTRALGDLGLEVKPAARRLAEFNAVQNTYLGTFQALGGLGLVLGSVGLGVVVLRNVLERRGELGLLLAVGFRPRALRRMILTEHAALLGLGLLVGVGAALVAVLPALLAPTTEVPVLSLGLTLLAVLVNGTLWTWLATRAALRGRLLDALRNE